MRGIALELGTQGARHEYLRGVVTGLGLSLVTQTFSVAMCYVHIQCCLHCTELQEQVCTVYQTTVGWCGSFKPVVGIEAIGTPRGLKLILLRQYSLKGKTSVLLS